MRGETARPRWTHRVLKERRLPTFSFVLPVSSGGVYCTSYLYTDVFSYVFSYVFFYVFPTLFPTLTIALHLENKKY